MINKTYRVDKLLFPSRSFVQQLLQVRSAEKSKISYQNNRNVSKMSAFNYFNFIIVNITIIPKTMNIVVKRG